MTSVHLSVNLRSLGGGGVFLGFLSGTGTGVIGLVGESGLLFPVPLPVCNAVAVGIVASPAGSSSDSGSSLSART